VIARPRLLIINGPIASGKSTLAWEVGKQFRTRGRTAAVIDLDVVYDMLDHRPKADAAVWRLARRTAAALADQLWRSGVELVAVEGSFCEHDERAEFLDALTTVVNPLVVTLRVSFDEALRRAQNDSMRKLASLSRDSTFLAWQHSDFMTRSDATKTDDLVVDTDARSALDVAAEVAGVLDARASKT
jgi:shikimate kinase